MKVKIVCINLEKDIARRQFMSNQLGDQVTFFPAIDAEFLEIQESKLFYKGKLLNVQHDKDMYLYQTALGFGRRHYRNLGIPYAHVDAKVDGNIVCIKYKDTTFYTDITPYKKNLSKTELACALSHYFVQKELATTDKYDAYIILEDDVCINVKELPTVLQHLENYYPLVDLLFLNHPQFITPDSLIDYTDLMNLGVFSGYSGAYSYILTKHGSLKINVNVGTIGMTADDFLSEQIQLHQTRLKIPICKTSDQFESTIKTSLTI